MLHQKKENRKCQVESPKTLNPDGAEDGLRLALKYFNEIGNKKDFLKIINLFSVNSVTGCIYTNQVSSNIWNQSIILSLQTIGPILVIFVMKVLKTDGN